MRGTTKKVSTKVQVIRSGFACDLRVRFDRLLIAVLDVTVVAGGRRIRAHKLVLLTHSAYLEGLLTNERLAAQGPFVAQELVISDLTEGDGAAVGAIIDLMYTGTLSLSSSSVCSVIRIANLLGVEAAEKAACDHFFGGVEIGTVCSALDLLCIEGHRAECTGTETAAGVHAGVQGDSGRSRLPAAAAP